MRKIVATLIILSVFVIDLEAFAEDRLFDQANPALLSKLFSGDELTLLSFERFRFIESVLEEINENITRFDFANAITSRTATFAPIRREELAAQISSDSQQGRKLLITIGFLYLDQEVDLGTARLYAGIHRVEWNTENSEVTFTSLSNLAESKFLEFRFQRQVQSMRHKPNRGPVAKSTKNSGPMFEVQPSCTAGVDIYTKLPSVTCGVTVSAPPIPIPYPPNPFPTVINDVTELFKDIGNWVEKTIDNLFCNPIWNPCKGR